jgi:acetyl-CoA carboxylase carboxyl transferase subunit alpha
LGGAHRDKDLILNNVKLSIQKNLNELSSMDREEVFFHRKNKFLSIGRNKGFTSKINNDENLTMEENFTNKIFIPIKKFKNKIIIAVGLLIFVLIIYFL